MKIFNINLTTPYFKGIRQDRNTIEQLKKDNSYDLNLPNQRKIANAIDNLSEVPGETNVNFLLDVSQNLKYGTSIDLGKSSYNDWQVRLNNAARKALSKSPQDVQEKLSGKLEEITNAPKNIDKDEKVILSLKDSLISKIDFEQLDTIKDNNIRALERNLDYFIVSSEVPLSQKLYIMKRLNHFMSDDYKINPQLENKKTQALAEIVNDITVNTPESKIPNIKSVNQKSHGMCAAISICRKLLAYEDKPNFVDMVMTELDSNDYMKVYDITKLGSGTKIPINKTNIDYTYALERGYRIIDTSALNWMHIGDTVGSANEPVGMYYPFDKGYFDTFHDSHLMPDMDNENLWAKQDYYRVLLKSKEAIGTVKKQQEKSKETASESAFKNSRRVQTVSKYTKLLESILSEISPNLKNDELHNIVNELQKLEVKNSIQAEKIKDFKHDFTYLPNESKNAKLEKIKAFLSISLAEKDSQKINKQAPEILEIIDTINDSNHTTKVNNKAKNINKAKNLYAAAAAYRTQQAFKIEIPENCDNMLQRFNIIDRETRISKNIDMLVDKLEKNELNPLIRETLAKNFQTDNDTEALIVALRENQNTLNYAMTELLDDFYKACLSKDRKNVLKNELTTIVNSIKDNNDKQTQKELADILKVKDNRQIILEILNKYIEILDSEDCTNEDYIKIYNKLGNKNQMKDFKEMYELLGDSIFKNKNSNIIMGFNLLHNLPKDAPLEETYKIFVKIGEQFNDISKLITGFQRALEVKTPDGEILNTVDSKEIILKKLENMHEIIPAKDLRKLQEKFTKIENARTNINGQTIFIKDLPAELTTFTPHEKEVLKLINSQINNWYSTTTRELNNQYKDIKSELEEHYRQIGVKTGQHWLRVEGESGLANYQQVKIIEHMTDRPYYIENNTRTAIQKLKESPYSGISCTSVDHKRPAWHAQYIADIKPLEIKTSKEIEIKDALFHDNTWGPIEHENLWTDENNFSRTDYNNNYGGSAGYITDDRYLNGNLLENLITQYGEQSSSLDSYKYPMFYDVITPGKDPHSNSYIRQIRENTLIHPSIYLKDLENQAKSMTKEQVKNVIQKTKSIGKNIDTQYSKVEEKVIGIPPLEKGIETKEAYDKLPDTDPVKILFEKIALQKSYNIPDYKVFYKKTTTKDLNSIRQTIQKEARKNFDYTFGKNPDIVKYLTSSVAEEVFDMLNEFAKENNIKISPSINANIISSLNKIDKSKFDGSSETTIRLMSDSFEKFMTKYIANLPNKKEKIENLADKVRKQLRTNIGFTLADLNSSSSEIKNIIKWIDDTFKPETDEEFVQIFNKLRNMTTHEFEEKYNSKITSEAMGIKKVSGYDLVKRFRNYEESVQNSVYNMLFNEQFGYNIQMSETVPSYEYNKLNKVIRGIYYKNKRTFDDIYLDYYYSLKFLSISKDYNRIKDIAFRKYGLFPAYPKMNIQEPEEVEKTITNFYNEISDSVAAIDAFKTQEKSINIINDLQKIGNKLKASIVPTANQRKFIQNKTNEFLKLNGEDDSIKDTINAAQQLITLDENATGKDYKTLIQAMYDEISLYTTTVDGKTMSESIKASVKEIQEIKQNFIMNIIEPKYQKKAYQLIEKWLNAQIKKEENADMYFDDFDKFFRKHMFINSPEKMLNEYLLLLASDSDNSSQEEEQKNENVNTHISNSNNTLTEEQKKKLEGVKETYKTNIQALLFNANILELQNILMECASNANLNIVRDGFKNSKILLPNGTVVNMDSDFAISTMLSPLLADSDLDTAVIFIEQLGLSERVIDMILKNADFKKDYHNIRRIDNIFTALSKQTKIIEKELKKLENLDNDPDYINTLETAKENIIRKFKRTNYSITTKIINETFKKAISLMQEHPEHSKLAYLHLCMENAKTASIYVAEQQVEKLNFELQKLQRKIDLVKRLKLPKDSPAEEKRQQYLAEVKKVEEYVSEHTRRYENLDMATGAYDV